MQTIALAGHAPLAINLNQPGSYLNWNVFTISVANLVLIAVMVVIFGVALLLPERHRCSIVTDNGRERSRIQAAGEGAAGRVRL